MEVNDWTTDPQLEREGVWTHVEPGDPARVRVARAENPAYRARARELLVPYQALLDNGGMPDDKSSEVGIRCVAETILLDWTGVTENGEPLEPTLENKVRVLTKSRDFLNRICEIAATRAHYLAAHTEAVAGN